MTTLRRYARYALYDAKQAVRHLLVNRVAGSVLVTRGLRLALYRTG